MSPARIFWRLARFRPVYYFADLFSITVHMALIPVQGLVLRAYFNGLTGAPGGIGAWQAAAWQLGLALAVVSFGGWAIMAYGSFKEQSITLLIRNMLARLLAMPGARPLPAAGDGSRMSVGEVVNTMRDDSENLLESMVIIDDSVGALVSSLIGLVIMLQLNWVVTLGTFLPLAAILLVVQRLARMARRFRRVQREATSQVTAMIADMFNATEALKVGQAEARIIARFREFNARRLEAMVRDRTLTQLVEALGSGSVDVGVGLVLLWAAQAMLSGDFTLGDFALFAAYIWPMTQAMRLSGRFITLYQQSRVAVERIETIMQGAPAGAMAAKEPIYLRQEPPPVPAPARTPGDRLISLRVADLTARYPDSEHGVFDISFELQGGDFVVLTGPIGSGKTTLLLALLGLLPSTSGRIWWNERLVRDPGRWMTPPRVAFTEQVPRLFSDSLRHNLLLGLPPEAVDLDEAVYQAVMERDVAKMEQGLDTLVGARGMRLSGGQVQRSAAARMFLRRPALLVCDDLSSALDVETERTLWDRLFARPDRPACLVVSHRPAVLQRADLILVLDQGRIVARGPAEALAARAREDQS